MFAFGRKLMEHPMRAGKLAHGAYRLVFGKMLGSAPTKIKDIVRRGDPCDSEFWRFRSNEPSNSSRSDAIR